MLESVTSKRWFCAKSVVTMALTIVDFGDPEPTDVAVAKIVRS